MQHSAVLGLHCDETHLANFALFRVVRNDRFSQVVKCLETFNDRLFVVVCSTARLPALRQAFLHRLVRHLRAKNSYIYT